MWVSPVGNGDTPVTVYVDYDADPSTGALTDPNGSKYDTSPSLKELERAKVYDSGDRNQTGMQLNTIAINDISRAPVPNLRITDTIPAGTAYVASSATFRNAAGVTSAIPDDGSGTPFPLDGTGRILDSVTALPVGGSYEVTFEVLEPDRPRRHAVQRRRHVLRRRPVRGRHLHRGDDAVRAVPRPRGQRRRRPDRLSRSGLPDVSADRRHLQPPVRDADHLPAHEPRPAPPAGVVQAAPPDRPGHRAGGSPDHQRQRRGDTDLLAPGAVKRVGQVVGGDVKPAKAAGGIFKMRMLRLVDGTYRVNFRTHGAMRAKTTLPQMSVQILVGDDVAITTQTWETIKTGWRVQLQ